MKLGVAVFVALLVGFGATAAEAAKKFPKALDSPIVRHKVRESHKTGTRVKHLMEGSRIG